MTKEELQQALLDRDDKLKALEEEKRTLNERLKKVEADVVAKDENIKSLQEHNQRLFLRVEQSREEEPTKKEPEKTITIDDVAKAYARR